MKDYAELFRGCNLKRKHYLEVFAARAHLLFPDLMGTLCTASCIRRILASHRKLLNITFVNLVFTLDKKKRKKNKKKSRPKENQ